MKISFSVSYLYLVVCALLFTAGCVSRYDITLTNQRVITTHGKPKVNKEKAYVSFTDVEGTKRVIPLITVRSIEAR